MNVLQHRSVSESSSIEKGGTTRATFVHPTTVAYVNVVMWFALCLFYCYDYAEILIKAI